MKDNSLYKLGGNCSVIVGISHAVIGITKLLSEGCECIIPYTVKYTELVV